MSVPMVPVNAQEILDGKFKELIRICETQNFTKEQFLAMAASKWGVYFTGQPSSRKQYTTVPIDRQLE